ncbi:unnamed protein product, partial [Mesorhabditis spiculigera]
MTTGIFVIEEIPLPDEPASISRERRSTETVYCDENSNSTDKSGSIASVRRKPLTGVLRVAEEFPCPSISGSPSLQKTDGPRLAAKLKALLSCKSSSTTMVLPSTSHQHQPPSVTTPPNNRLPPLPKKEPPPVDEQNNIAPPVAPVAPKKPPQERCRPVEEKMPFFYIYLALLFIIVCLVALSVWNYYSALQTYKPSTLFPRNDSHLNRVERFNTTTKT